MKRLKVAILGGYPLPREYYDSPARYTQVNRGGVPVHIERLAHYISQMGGIDLHVITLGNRNERFEQDNLTIHVLKSTWFTHSSIVIEAMLLRREIRRIDPDIVHVQGTYFPYSLAAVLVRNQYTAVMTVHGVIAEDIKFEGGLKRLFGFTVSKRIEKCALSRIPYTIAVTPQIKELISSWTTAGIQVIPNGIDPAGIGGEHKPEANKKFDLFYIGLLIKRKGVETLVRAVSLVRAEIPGIRLGIAGAGAQAGELKVLVKELGLAENIAFLGFLDGDEKYRYIASADLVAVPSLWEPFGIVLLEAMACARPVIASRTGGIPSIVVDGETGLLFEPGDVADLAGKILRLAQDRSLRDKMGRAGLERAREFAWDRIAERTVELYRRILEGG